MQSTGQTSKQLSHPVQLSAWIIASSLGIFFLTAFFAIKFAIGNYVKLSTPYIL